MPSAKAESAPVISGIGVATAFGYGVSTFRQALRQPGNRFGVMQRPGRHASDATFPGAELPDPPAGILSARIARTTGLTGHVAVAVLQEAWRDANLDRVAPEKIGLVIGGSNTQAREHLLIQQSYAAKLHFLSPQYGHRFFDSDLCGLCTSVFPIRGFAYTLGGASASGLLAVQHAADAVRSGRVEACIALGALQDLSYFECQALRSLGAMAVSAGRLTRVATASYSGSAPRRLSFRAPVQAMDASLAPRTSPMETADPSHRSRAKSVRFGWR